MSDRIWAILLARGEGKRWKRLYDKARDCYDRGQYKRAERLLDKSVKCKPNIPAYYLLACVKESSGDTYSASRMFQAILCWDSPQLDSNIYSGAHCHLGEMHYRYKDLLEAQYHLEQCLNIEPSHEKAMEYLERIRAECEAESFLGPEMQFTNL